MYKDLIGKLVQEGTLKTKSIIKAFYKINREDFVEEEMKKEAGIDVALPIEQGQTISQPFTVAFMFELLQPEEGNKVLDIGSGSGWTTALLAEIVGKDGKVYGIEKIEELKKFGEENIKKYDFIKEGRVEMFLGDGTKGLLDKAPFDKILVSAAILEIPKPLLDQLQVGGRMVIPVGPVGSQDIVLVKKIKEDKFEKEKYPGFVFVPLIPGD